MNGRVNDKVKEADLEAICSKRCDEIHSHDLSPEDIVNNESKLRAVMSGPGPIERILPDKPSSFNCEILKQPTKQHGKYGEMTDGLVRKENAVISGPDRSLNLNPAASKQPIRTIDADLKLAQKQKDVMEDLKIAGPEIQKWIKKYMKTVETEEHLEKQINPMGELEGELEQQMKTISEEEYERALASNTAAEAYKSALAAKAALMTMHAKENAETARRQQAAERLVEAELIRAAHRLKFELWASERLRNT